MFHSVAIDLKNKLWSCGLRKYSGHGNILNYFAFTKLFLIKELEIINKL